VAQRISVASNAGACRLARGGHPNRSFAGADNDRAVCAIRRVRRALALLGVEANLIAERYMIGFARYIGIDYSGGRLERACRARVYIAEGEGLPIEVLPPR
jgi:hypothetical protein